MTIVRLSFAVVLLAVLMVAANVSAMEPPSTEPRRVLLNLPPITIVNERTSDWEVKVWAYSGEAKQADIYSCQTIHWNSDYARQIEPWQAKDILEQLFYDHCANYETPVPPESAIAPSRARLISKGETGGIRLFLP